MIQKLLRSTCRAAIVAVDVVDVLDEAGVIGLRIGQVARPREVGVDVRLAREALGHLHLQRVVVRAEDRTQRVDCEVTQDMA